MNLRKRLASDDQSMRLRAGRDRSGKRSKAGRKLSERERKVAERERSYERTKLAAQISLKGDASLLKLRKSVLPDVKNKLSTAILIPISNRLYRYAYFVSKLRLVISFIHSFYLYQTTRIHRNINIKQHTETRKHSQTLRQWSRPIYIPN